MARQNGVSLENNFIKGLFTEASGLTFPENACTTTVNNIHSTTGEVTRRKGFDYENRFELKNVTRIGDAVSYYLWRDVAGDGDRTFLVVQAGVSLLFYDASTTDPVSTHAFSSTIDLSSFAVGGSPPVGDVECQFTAGNGKLFVAHPYCNAFSVTFDVDTQSFSMTTISLEIRDFEGLEDSLPVDYRPVVNMGGISDAHLYNLYNQGWNATGLVLWDNGRSDMPSNCDVMWSFKNSSDQFDVSTVGNRLRGNSPAPKGHFILNVFNKNRQSVSGIIVPSETTGYQRASTIAFFAGRLFFSGINYLGTNSTIYFSQIIERDDQFGKCYQTNDPTSDEAFDLLSSDGGTIVIQDAGSILKLIAVPGGLLVFASNGIWLISGSTGLGFAATDYTVSKISSVSALTQTSFVDLAGIPVWWNQEGIYQIESSQSGAFKVTSITDQTIKGFYNAIPPSEKRYAKGSFNPVAGIVQWLYRSTETNNIREKYEYDRVLVLNTLTGGFYVWTIPDHAVKVHGLFVLENRNGDLSLDDVEDVLGQQVLTVDGAPVQVWDLANSLVSPSFKYIVSNSDAFTFAETYKDTYLDWEASGTPADFDSYFITGYRSKSNSLTDFQSNYVVFYSKAGSKFSVSGIWDFTNTGNSGRWSNPQVIDATGVSEADVSIDRRKIRGQGKSLQIKVDSSTGKPYTVKGWSMFVSAEDKP